MAALGRTRLHRHAPGEAHQLGQSYAAHLDHVAALHYQPPFPACRVGQPQHGGNVGAGDRGRHRHEQRTCK